MKVILLSMALLVMLSLSVTAHGESTNAVVTVMEYVPGFASAIFLSAMILLMTKSTESHKHAMLYFVSGAACYFIIELAHLLLENHIAAESLGLGEAVMHTLGLGLLLYGVHALVRKP